MRPAGDQPVTLPLGGVMAIVAGTLHLGLERFVAPAVVGLADIAGLFTYLAIIAPRVLALI